MIITFLRTVLNIKNWSSDTCMYLLPPNQNKMHRYWSFKALAQCALPIVGASGSLDNGPHPSSSCTSQTSEILSTKC